MKIYLASRYSRYPEMQKYRDILEAAGHSVTSRWIEGNHQINDSDWPEELKQKEFQQFAMNDMEDLSNADMVLSFTEKPGPSSSLGGRHVEFGLALSCKKCAIIGPRENVFHYLRQVDLYPDFDTFCLSFLHKALTTRFVCECGFEFSISNEIKDKNAIKAHRKCVCGKEMREKTMVIESEISK